MRHKILNLLKYLLGWPISIVALLFIFTLIFQKSENIAPLMSQINYFNLSIGIFFLLSYFFIRGHLWHVLVRSKIDIDSKESIYRWAMAELKRYIPGNIWSFLGRAFSFEEKGLTKKEVGVLLLHETQFFLTGSILVSLLSLRFVFNLLNISNNQLFLTFIIYFVISILLIAFIFNVKFKEFIKNRFIKAPFSIFPSFSWLKNLKFLSLATVAMTCFGLGSYFSAISLFNLDIKSFLSDSSFLTFSLLIGYLSIITPMGLGIREAIVTLGFANIIGVENAGILAIFVRIVLIISELLFVALVAHIHSQRKNLLSMFYAFVKRKWHESLLLLLMLFYFLYFTITSFLRFDNFYTGRFDLGNMVQVVWNTIHGKIFLLTNPNGTEPISRLAFHADFILIFLSPFYLLWSSPKVLLLIQAVILTFGALFVYKISNIVIKNKNVSLVFAISYLLNPSLQYANLYDFHGVTLATTFLLATLYYAIKRKYFWTIFFAMLAGSTKEQVWIINGLIGIYLIFSSYREKRVYKNASVVTNVVFTVFSFCVFFYLVWIAIPNALGGQHFALSYYSEFGDTPGQIVKSIILNPLKILTVFVQKDQLDYLYSLFFPVGFISIFNPFFLIFTLPELLISLLSSNSQLRDIYYQYTSTVTPFIFISAIYGFRFLARKINKTVLCVYLLGMSLWSAYLIGPLPFAKHANVAMYTKPLQNKEVIINFLNTIPRNLSIAASNNLGSHLSERDAIFTIPVGLDKADIIAFLLNDSYAQPSLAAQKEMANKLRNDPDYTLLFEDGDFIAFQKVAK